MENNKCPNCGYDYSKRVVKEDHIEVVCKECNFGRIFKEIKTPNLLLTSTSSRKNEIQF